MSSTLRTIGLLTISSITVMGIAVVATQLPRAGETAHAASGAAGGPYAAVSGPEAQAIEARGDPDRRRTSPENLLATGTIAGAATIFVPVGGLILDPPQAVEGNGVTVELLSVGITPFSTEAEMCIQLPTAADWNPEAHLAWGQVKVTRSEWTMLNWRDPATLASQHRCYRFTFSYAGPGQPKELQLVVERLATSPEVTEEVCAAGRGRLRTENPALDFTCNIDRGQEGGGVRIDILQKPAEMSEEQAYGLIMDSFKEIVQGPWAFPLAVP